MTLDSLSYWEAAENLFAEMILNETRYADNKIFTNIDLISLYRVNNDKLSVLSTSTQMDFCKWI